MSLAEFVREQRWFGAKAQEVVEAEVVDRAVLSEDPELVDALVELRYGDGNRDLYQLLLGEDGVDAIAEPAFGRALVSRMRENAVVPSEDGSLTFASLLRMPGDTPLEEVRLLGGEQSNSALVVDDAIFVKVFRRIEAGENPDLELTRFLCLNGFENVPALLGWWEYGGPLLTATLGIAQEYVPGAVDGWSLALEELAARPDDFVPRCRRLGEVVGRMHAVLAGDAEDPAFAPEEAGAESLALLAASMDDEIADVFQRLPDRDATVAPLVGRGDAVRDLLRSLAAISSLTRRIRCHGDLHLGQVLWARGDWLVIDFEGEPARPLPERRVKGSPLRDVAGMLRSFTYAAVVTEAGPAVEGRARAAFLDAYLGAVQGTGLLPSREATERLLRMFELEKAVYELRYELAHRPDWVPIPVAGILRLLEEGF